MLTCQSKRGQWELSWKRVLNVEVLKNVQLDDHKVLSSAQPQRSVCQSVGWSVTTERAFPGPAACTQQKKAAGQPPRLNKDKGALTETQT